MLAKELVAEKLSGQTRVAASILGVTGRMSQRPLTSNSWHSKPRPIRTDICDYLISFSDGTEVFGSKTR